MAKISYFQAFARKIAMNKDGSAKKDISFLKTVFEIYIRYSSMPISTEFDENSQKLKIRQKS
jgi:hypothetical protein